MNFAGLNSDLLSKITFYLSFRDIFELWMLGDRKLQRKLLNGGVLNISLDAYVHFNPYRFFKRFIHLESVSVLIPNEMRQGRFGIGIENALTKLVSLDLSGHVDFSILLDAVEDSSFIFDYRKERAPVISQFKKNMNENFPVLQTLKCIFRRPQSGAPLLILPESFKNLPSSLNTLHFDVFSNSGGNKLFCDFASLLYMPESLTDLSFSYSCSSPLLNLGLKDKAVVSFTANHESKKTSQLYPKYLRSLVLTQFDPGDGNNNWLNFLKHPYGPAVTDDIDFTKYFCPEDSSLEHFRYKAAMRHVHFWTGDKLGLLPKSLTSLHISSSRFDDSWTPNFPPKLKRLQFAAVGNRFPIEIFCKSIPRGLTSLILNGRFLHTEMEKEIATLPKSLTEMDIDASIDANYLDKSLPPHLKAMNLSMLISESDISGDITESAELPPLPPTLEALTSASYFGIQKLLPPSLKAWYIDIHSMHDSHNITEPLPAMLQTFSSLKSQLRSEADLIRYFPQTLTTLQLGSGFKADYVKSLPQCLRRFEAADWVKVEYGYPFVFPPCLTSLSMKLIINDPIHDFGMVLGKSSANPPKENREEFCLVQLVKNLPPFCNTLELTLESESSSNEIGPIDEEEATMIFKNLPPQLSTLHLSLNTFSNHHIPLLPRMLTSLIISGRYGHLDKQSLPGWPKSISAIILPLHNHPQQAGPSHPPPPPSGYSPNQQTHDGLIMWEELSPQDWLDFSLLGFTSMAFSQSLQMYESLVHEDFLPNYATAFRFSMKQRIKGNASFDDPDVLCPPSSRPTSRYGR